MNLCRKLALLIPRWLVVSQHDVDATLVEINRKLEAIMHTLDDLVAEVAAEKTQIDSLVALTAGLKQQVIDAMGGALTPSQQMRIDQVFDAVASNADEVAKAITDNTVQASSGAVSGGPLGSDIKTSLNPAPSTDPAPASTDPAAASGS